MTELLEKIAVCVERGKVDSRSSYPPDLKGQEGADELSKKALDQGVAPGDLLNKALITGMQRIGVKFRDNKVFVPDVLMAAKAMSAAMAHIRPHFLAGTVKGTFLIGTVAGDLHDIGKNLVAMMIEGSGWEVIDLGVDVEPDVFVKAIAEHTGCVIGLSALLTTTMVSMERTVKEIRAAYPEIRVCVGGAPLTREFANSIGADCYAADPQGAIDYLNSAALHEPDRQP
jgi:methanogenic corrinoid protein MtbC1